MANSRQFFIVGAQRSGTTYLYRLLEQHPDICMARPARPEPKFFLDNLPVTSDTRTSYLQRFFGHHRAESLLGEKSTSYIESEAAAKRITAHFPDAHIVFVLRDPVWRAISNYRFSLGNGLEHLPLSDALDAEASRLSHGPAADASVSPYAYAQRGHYVRYLDTWRRHVAPTRMHVLVSEHLLGVEGSLRELLRRLEVASDVAFSGIHDHVNETTNDVEVEAAVLDRLRESFVNSNRLLAERYELDLSPWT